MKTAFRYGIATKRLCDALNERIFGQSKIKRKAAVAMLIDTGEQTTISGSGQVFEKFQRTGVMDGYTGFGMSPTKFSDPDADTALLRDMAFDETYHGMTYDVTCSKHFVFLHNVKYESFLSIVF